MSQDEQGDRVRCLLDDLDDRQPGRSFAPPEGLTTTQAYALQREVGRLREERGENVIGYKIGCTSRAIQAQLGINEPIFGRLFDTGGFERGPASPMLTLPAWPSRGKARGPPVARPARSAPVGR